METTKNNLVQLPDNIAIAFMALTTIIMAYSFQIGMVAILIMYAMWLPLTYYKGHFTLRPSIDIALPIIFALYCVTSAMWSAYPSISIYSGVQYASMIACAIIMARRVRLDAFLKGISLGVLLVLLALFHTGSFSFSGMFGSKNQVGFFSEIGIFIATLLFFHIKNAPLQKLFYSIIPLIISIICLGLSHSASSIISTFLVLMVCLVAFIIGKMARPARAPIFALILFGVATFAMTLYAFEIDLQGEILEFFGKDRTLTGRTDLWQDGLEFAKQSPIIGNGYNAFWVVGQPIAERLWAEFYIDNKTGFHFHNLFIQTLVDLGAIGLFIMVLMLLTFSVKSIIGLLKNGAEMQHILFIGLTFLFLTRAFVEVDILNTYGIGPLLFFAVIPYLFLHGYSNEHAPQT